MDKQYAECLQKDETEIRERFAELWEAAGQGPLTPDAAQRTLNWMFKRSMLDILEKLPEYAEHYPAQMGYRRRLEHVTDLWWIDHATAGINGWGTLGWFSNKKRRHTYYFSDKIAAEKYARRRKTQAHRKHGQFYVSWTGYSNAITHFVVFPDGTPFMLLPLEDGCWGEPKRNGDAIQVEIVNPLVVRRSGTEWRYWAGKIPNRIVQVQRPEALETLFRGATHMVPYLWEQIITNIKLKRVCIAATTKQMKSGDVELTPRMARDRMSQHTDWRKTKFDMGPLWPFDLCNNAAFEPYPIESYSFMQNFVHAEGADPVADYDEIQALERQASNEEILHDLWDSDDTIDSVKRIQESLIRLYGPKALPRYGVDGSMGAETTRAVRHFQVDWNKNHKNDPVKEDGVPGVQTCTRLEIAFDAGVQFNKTPF